MAQEKARDSRVRNFATMVYPESAPENWRETLAGYFVPGFISPIHDKENLKRLIIMLCLCLRVKNQMIRSGRCFKPLVVLVLKK